MKGEPVSECAKLARPFLGLHSCDLDLGIFPVTKTCVLFDFGQPQVNQCQFAQQIGGGELGNCGRDDQRMTEAQEMRYDGGVRFVYRDARPKQDVAHSRVGFGVILYNGRYCSIVILSISIRS